MSLFTPLLSLLIWLPVIGGIALLAIGDGSDAGSSRAGVMRIAALAVSLITFLLSIGLYTGFDAAAADMQFVERHASTSTTTLASTVSPRR